MDTIKLLDKSTLILLIVGGLNWGLVGLFNIDLVAKLLGADTILSQLIYALIGISAVYIAVNCKKYCRR